MDAATQSTQATLQHTQTGQGQPVYEPGPTIPRGNVRANFQVGLSSLPRK